MTEGLSKREMIAAMAMQGLLACPKTEGSTHAFALDAVGYADALLAELARTAPQAPTKHNPPQGFVLDAPIFGEARTAPQEGAEVDWSDDEAVVRAAVPDADLDMKGRVHIGSYPWDDLRTARRLDPAVVAFENEYNPARKEQR